MPADEFDRARAKCRSGRHKCFCSDCEATGRHARLQFSLRRHRLKRQLRGGGGNSAISNHASRNAYTRHRKLKARTVSFIRV
jgi:hypothetical protein